jgi:hypothetical protein
MLWRSVEPQAVLPSGVALVEVRFRGNRTRALRCRRQDGPPAVFKTPAEDIPGSEALARHEREPRLLGALSRPLVSRLLDC